MWNDVNVKRKALNLQKNKHFFVMQSFFTFSQHNVTWTEFSTELLLSAAKFEVGKLNVIFSKCHGKSTGLIIHQWVPRKSDNLACKMTISLAVAHLWAQLVIDVSCNNEKTISASAINKRVKRISILFPQCSSTTKHQKASEWCSLMGAWFSESTPALLAHYLFIGLLRSCGVQAWWVECHFTCISREINLFLLAVTYFDRRLALAWILQWVNV